jgi:hypothetical protein
MIVGLFSHRHLFSGREKSRTTARASQWYALGRMKAFFPAFAQLSFNVTKSLSVITLLIGLLLMPLITCVAVAIGAPQSSDPMRSEDSFELRPGVIVAPSAGEIYAMNPQHGIDAIDIASGKILWTSNAAAKPILLDDHHLVAQAEAGGAGALQTVGLDTAAAGKTVLRTTLALAQGVNPSIDESLGSSFEIHGKADGVSVIVSWRFTRSPASGVIVRVSPPDIQMNGAARIDLSTGAVKPLNPKPSSLSGNAPLPKNLQRMVDSGKLPSAPQAVGDFFIATKTVGDNHQVLQRWNKHGDELASIELDPGIGIANPSADDRMVFSRRRLDPAPDGMQRYLWSIFSIETGKRIAQVRMPTSASPFVVWHSMLIFEALPFGHRVNGAWVQVPLQVSALNLANGEMIWSHTIRDTRYRGAMTPIP